MLDQPGEKLVDPGDEDEVGAENPVDHLDQHGDSVQVPVTGNVDKYEEDFEPNIAAEVEEILEEGRDEKGHRTR